MLLEKCPAGLAPGEFLTARVTGYDGYDLVAKVETGSSTRRPHNAPRTGGVALVSLPVMGSVETRGKRG